jgi:WD40 repeat protein
VASRKPLGEPLKAHKDAAWSVAFSPDGKTLATGSWDEAVILWEVASRKLLGEPLTGHKGPVSSVAFSPDGKTLATGSWAQTVILWDVASRKPLGEPLEGHTRGVSSVAFSPDGKTLATGSDDHTVILWDADVEAWKRRACEIVNRNFTTSEWREYMGERRYRKVCPRHPGPDDPDWPFKTAPPQPSR